MHSGALVANYPFDGPYSGQYSVAPDDNVFTVSPSSFTVSPSESQVVQIVFSPDDVSVMRDTLSNTVRDNVLFELGLFIGFNVGFHVFFGTLDFYPMFTPDGRLVSQEESRRIYGTKPVSLASGLAVGAGPEADQ